RADEIVSKIDGKVKNIVSDIHWADSDNKFVYKVNSKNGDEYFIIDAIKKTKRKAFDKGKFVKELADVSKKEIDTFNLPITSLKLVPDKNQIEFSAFENKWKLNLDTYNIKKKTKSDAQTYVHREREK